MTSTVANFIDKLLNNWTTIPGTTPGTPTPSFSDASTDLAKADTIKGLLKNLYLVFHYPQGTGATPTDFGNLSTKLIASDRIFNYVYTADNSFEKTLLSKNGITKANMITLKMFLDEIKADSTDSAKILEILTKPPNDTSTIEVTNPATLGGGNTMVPKIGGKNKSNKRVRKLRRKNKSSKSHRSEI
jgi:hypothetical protein